MWHVYVVVCCDNSFYCGITTNLSRRLKQHNGEIKGGAKYTRSRRPCRLVYTKKAMNRSIASKFEYRFKQLSRSKKEDFINQEDLHLQQARLGFLHLLLEETRLL